MSAIESVSHSLGAATAIGTAWTVRMRLNVPTSLAVDQIASSAPMGSVSFLAHKPLHSDYIYIHDPLCPQAVFRSDGFAMGKRSAETAVMKWDAPRKVIIFTVDRSSVLAGSLVYCHR